MAAATGQVASSSDMKASLLSELKGSGVLDNVRSTLRTQLLAFMKTRMDPAAPPAAPPSLYHRVLDSLVADYLGSRGLALSLSVFSPEAGLSGPSGKLSPAEILEALKISEDAPAHRFFVRSVEASQGPSDAPDAPPSHDSLALGMIRALVALGSATHRAETCTQTSADADDRLAAQLNQIDAQYLRRVETERGAPARAAEERMAAYRRDCEARLRAEIDAGVQRVRDVEVPAARIDEAAKQRRIMEREREELDRQHRARMRQVREREERLVERLRLQKDEVESLAFRHRQRILQEEKRLTEIRAAAEQHEKATRERLDAREAQLREREAQAAAKETEAARALAESRRQVAAAGDDARLQVQRELAQGHEELRQRQADHARARAQLENDRQELAAELTRVRVLEERLRAAEARTAQEAARALAAEAMLGRIREEDEKLRLEVSLLRGGGGLGGPHGAGGAGHQAAQAQAAAAEARVELEAARRELKALKRHCAELQRAQGDAAAQVTAMDAEVARAQAAAAAWQGACESTEQLLEEALAQKEEALGALEELRIALRSAYRDTAEEREQARRLRAMLGKSEGVAPPRAEVPAGAAAEMALAEAAQYRDAVPSPAADPLQSDDEGESEGGLASVPPFLEGVGRESRMRLREIEGEEDRLRVRMDGLRRRAQALQEARAAEDWRAAAQVAQQQPRGAMDALRAFGGEYVGRQSDSREASDSFGLSSDSQRSAGGREGPAGAAADARTAEQTARRPEGNAEAPRGASRDPESGSARTDEGVRPGSGEPRPDSVEARPARPSDSGDHGVVAGELHEKPQAPTAPSAAEGAAPREPTPGAPRDAASAAVEPPVAERSQAEVAVAARDDATSEAPGEGGAFDYVAPVRHGDSSRSPRSLASPDQSLHSIPASRLVQLEVQQVAVEPPAMRPASGQGTASSEATSASASASQRSEGSAGAVREPSATPAPPSTSTSPGTLSSSRDASSAPADGPLAAPDSAAAPPQEVESGAAVPAPQRSESEPAREEPQQDVVVATYQSARVAPSSSSSSSSAAQRTTSATAQEGARDVDVVSAASDSVGIGGLGEFSAGSLPESDSGLALYQVDQEYSGGLGEFAALRDGDAWAGAGEGSAVEQAERAARDVAMELEGFGSESASIVEDYESVGVSGTASEAGAGQAGGQSSGDSVF
ncbi:unnamed protein product [Pedinophyceae sp. YPF-701]|nr:unnamed protein product [Pedinophyceae sp. YPF-701]